MERKEIIPKLKSIYEEVLGRTIEDAEIGDGEGITDKLFIDSLLGLQIIIKIEQNFHIVIEDDELAIRLVDSWGMLTEYITNDTASAGIKVQSHVG